MDCNNNNVTELWVFNKWGEKQPLDDGVCRKYHNWPYNVKLLKGWKVQQSKANTRVKAVKFLLLTLNFTSSFSMKFEQINQYMYQAELWYEVDINKN